MLHKFLSVPWTRRVDLQRPTRFIQRLSLHYDKAVETWRVTPMSTQNEATGQQTIGVEELSCKAASPIVFKLEIGEP